MGKHWLYLLMFAVGCFLFYFGNEVRLESHVMQFCWMIGGTLAIVGIIWAQYTCEQEQKNLHKHNESVGE